MIVDAGLKKMLDLLDGTSTSKFTHGASGTDGTAVTSADTTLGTEVIREAFQESVADSAFNKWRTRIFLDSTEGNGNSMQEYGTLNAGASGDLLNRWTHSSFSKTVDSQIFYNNFFTFSRYASTDGLVVNEGLERIRDLIFDTGSGITNIARGSSSTTPAVTDTSLGAETDDYTADSVTQDDTDMRLTYVKEITPLAVSTWKETGLKTSDGKLIAHRTHTTINTVVDKRYRITYKMRIRGS